MFFCRGKAKTSSSCSTLFRLTNVNQRGRSVSVLVSNLASFSVNDTQIISCSLQKNSKSSGFVERKITFALGLVRGFGK